MVLNRIRWILTPLSATLGLIVFGAAIMGIGLSEFVDSLCPVEKNFGGHCTVTWVNDLSKALVPIGTGVSAIIVVLVPSLIAPNYKVWVATGFYCLGGLAALWFFFGSNALWITKDYQILPLNWSNFELLLIPWITASITLLSVIVYKYKKPKV